MTVKMILDNGVTAQVSVRHSCKRKTRAKRKYTKIKDKIIETIVVRFIPPRGRRSMPASASPTRRSGWAP